VSRQTTAAAISLARCHSPYRSHDLFQLERLANDFEAPASAANPTNARMFVVVITTGGQFSDVFPTQLL